MLCQWLLDTSNLLYNKWPSSTPFDTVQKGLIDLLQQLKVPINATTPNFTISQITPETIEPEVTLHILDRLTAVASDAKAKASESHAIKSPTRPKIGSENEHRIALPQVRDQVHLGITLTTLISFSINPIRI